MSLPAGFSATVAHRVTPPGDPELFPTPPWAARAGGELIRRLDPRARTCWEPAAGRLHMVHGLADYFSTVHASDAFDHGAGCRRHDFLSPGGGPYPRPDWIVTNPPFDHAESFCRKAWDNARRGVAMLCRLAFCETIGRYDLFNGDRPLAVEAVFCERVAMLKGRWEPDASTASAYAWFVWLKPIVRSTEADLARAARRQMDAALRLHIPPGTKARLSRASDLRFAGVAE